MYILWLRCLHTYLFLIYFSFYVLITTAHRFEDSKVYHRAS